VQLRLASSGWSQVRRTAYECQTALIFSC
jgi:hypothetical protein